MRSCDMAMHVQHVQLAVDLGALQQDAVAALGDVLRAHVHMRTSPVGSTEMHWSAHRIHGAMTNFVYLCSGDQGGQAMQLIARVCGSGSDGTDTASTDMETACSLAAAATGQGPCVLLTFDNGRLEEYLQGYRHAGIQFE